MGKRGSATHGEREKDREPREHVAGGSFGMNREHDVGVQDGFEVAREPVADSGTRDVEREVRRSGIVVVREW